MAERTLVRLGPGRSAELRPALRDAGLPADDLGDAAALYRLDGAAGPLGWAAVERHGADGLLRSVVVRDGGRGRGAGTELVTRVIAAAAGEGVERLWLLTEAAAPFFAGLGFAPVDRTEAPEAIQRTSEFAATCPASAACMTLALARP